MAFIHRIIRAIAILMGTYAGYLGGQRFRGRPPASHYRKGIITRLFNEQFFSKS